MKLLAMLVEFAPKAIHFETWSARFFSPAAPDGRALSTRKSYDRRPCRANPRGIKLIAK